MYAVCSFGRGAGIEMGWLKFLFARVWGKISTNDLQAKHPSKKREKYHLEMLESRVLLSNAPLNVNLQTITQSGAESAILPAAAEILTIETPQSNASPASAASSNVKAPLINWGNAQERIPSDHSSLDIQSDPKDGKETDALSLSNDGKNPSTDSENLTSEVEDNLADHHQQAVQNGLLQPNAKSSPSQDLLTRSKESASSETNDNIGARLLLRQEQLNRILIHKIY